VEASLMNFNIDDWIPNFTLFMWLTFVCCVSIFFILLAYWWATRRRLTFAEYLAFIPAIYMIFVFYEAWTWWTEGTPDNFFQRLFVQHFYNMMFLVLCVGIGQVLYFFVSERRATT
jgi:hypothetical protein